MRLGKGRAGGAAASASDGGGICDAEGKVAVKLGRVGMIGYR